MGQGEALLERSAPRSKRSIRYWLEDIDLSGVRTMHGPVEVDPCGSGLRAHLSKYERPRFLSELGKKLEERYEEAWKVQELRERLRTAPLKDRHASSVTRGALTLEAKASNLKARRADPQGNEVSAPPTFDLVPDPQAAALHRGLAGRHAVKLLVKEEGWYRVSRSELVAAGLSRDANPQYLQLYAEGREVPIRVVMKKPGESSTWKAIDFYGTGLDTLSTDTRVYWLVEGSAPGQRIGVSARTGGPAGSPSFAYTVQRKDRTIYFAGLMNGDQSNFFGPMIYQWLGAVDQILEVSNLDLSASGDAMLEVGVQGSTYTPHVIDVLVNDNVVGTLSWDGQTAETGVFSVPQSYLLEGENLVTLLPLGGDMDVSLLDYIHLTYSHSYTADGDELKCQAQGGERISIDGFSTPEVRVYDITNPYRVVMARREVVSDGTGGYRATFTVPGKGERTLLALTDQKIKTPAEVRTNQPSNWRQATGRKLLIITHKDFIESVQPLKALRKSEGLSVWVVDIEDVYDEFSFGEKSPQALKAFLRYASKHWSSKPKYVLLVGDGSLDARDYLGYGDQDYVPAKLIDTYYLETASDDWFVDFDDDGLPDLAIGRLPVQMKEEADALVSKIVGYGQSNPMSEALLVADQVDPGDYDFEGGSEALAPLLPASVGVRKVFRGQYGSDAEAKEALLGGINEGPLLVNYVGHGSIGTWRGDVLTLAVAEGLTNGAGLPFFVNMTCLNGYFQGPDTDSLGETLIKKAQGGAVAVWTSSGLTVPNEQAVMNQEFMRLLFSSTAGGESLRLGEAAMRAKAATLDQDVRRTWILFGDPTMRLRQ